jgi:5-methylcytosine-specific restriction endonuclease McrA
MSASGAGVVNRKRPRFDWAKPGGVGVRDYAGAGLREVKQSTETERDQFYISREWRALVAHIKRERGNRCERCGAAGPYIQGDHRVERKDGGAPLDPLNVQLLCLTCHNRKTADAVKARKSKGWHDLASSMLAKLDG